MAKAGSASHSLRTAFTVILLLVSMAGAVLGGCVLAFRQVGLAKPHAIDVIPPKGATAGPRIVVRPGEVLWLQFYKDSSLQGYWATSGITLNIKAWTARLTIVESRQPRWGNRISSTEDKAFSIVGRLEIPDSPGTGPGNLSGLIQGRITMPRKVLDPILHTPGSFTELEHDLSVPLNLRLIGKDDPAQTTYEAAYGERARREQRLLWLAFVGGIAGLWVSAKLSARAGSEGQAPTQT